MTWLKCPDSVRWNRPMNGFEAQMFQGQDHSPIRLLSFSSTVILYLLLWYMHKKCFFATSGRLTGLPSECTLSSIGFRWHFRIGFQWPCAAYRTAVGCLLKPSRIFSLVPRVVGNTLRKPFWCLHISFSTPFSHHFRIMDGSQIAYLVFFHAHQICQPS